MIKKYFLHCRPEEQVETEISICKNFLQIFQFYKSVFLALALFVGSIFTKYARGSP